MTKTRRFLKVKVFSSLYPETLKKFVDDFLRSLKPEDIEDIKYSTSGKWSDCIATYYTSEEEEV